MACGALSARILHRHHGRLRGRSPVLDLLISMAHPLAHEIRDLTTIYIESRFGGRTLGDEERRSFEKRVRALRTLNTQQQN